MPIDERIEAFAYLVDLQMTFAMSVQAPKGMEALQCVQRLKARLEGATRLAREFCLTKREAAAKPRFTRMLAQFFNEDIAELSRAGMSLGMHVRRFAANFPHPEVGGTCPASGVSADTRWVTKGRSDASRCERELASRAINGGIESRRGEGR